MEEPDGHLGAADPARAFEDLRAEVSILRRAVEALPGSWEENQPPDYSPDMGRIAKGLNAVAGQLDTIQKHPALLLTPEQHRQAVAQAGSGLMREAVQTLDRAAQNAVHERQQLASLIGVARVQDQQFRALCWASGIALVVGLVLSPLVAGLLPFGLNTRIAALVMREGRWDAGTALMQAASPSGWGRLVDSADVVRLNDDALRACRAAAAKAKKAQRCTITVSAN
jgi:hypothetical protein